MFGDMCAYCEAPYAATTQVDVEHYRPKGGVTGRNGKLVKPDYYWLAATWENLLPSCPDCNREREQKFEDADPRKAGKANKFPLADERRRATRPGQEGRESPLLLDPCCDDPAEHLVFNDRGNVDPRPSRGKPSRAVHTMTRRATLQ